VHGCGAHASAGNARRALRWLRSGRSGLSNRMGRPAAVRRKFAVLHTAGRQLAVIHTAGRQVLLHTANRQLEGTHKAGRQLAAPHRQTDPPCYIWQTDHWRRYIRQADGWRCDIRQADRYAAFIEAAFKTWSTKNPNLCDFRYRHFGWCGRTGKSLSTKRK
jgi:hypothetical protein